MKTLTATPDVRARFAAMPGSASFDLEPHAGSETRRGLVGVGGVFFGRPRGRLPGFGGSAPFARTASALASDVAMPPSRPSACAARFLVVTARFDSEFCVESVHLLVGEVGAQIVNGLRGVFIFPVRVIVAGIGIAAPKGGSGSANCGAVFLFDVGGDGGVVRYHARNKANRLGFVTNYFRKSFEREIPSGRRGCGAGENARERHEGKTLNAKSSDGSGGRA